MEPEIDLDFLAEASPRECLASPISLRSLSPLYRTRPTGNEDLKAFLETSVRCMAYRAFIRWYHGSFSGRSRVSRLLLNYFAAVAVMLAVYTFVCVDTVPAAALVSEFDDRFFFKGFFLTNATFLALSTLIFVCCSQTPRVVILSVWGSRLFILSSLLGSVIQLGRHARFSDTGRLQFDECPTLWPSIAFPLTITILLAYQMCLALAALTVDLLAIRIGRFYILYSKYSIRSWGAEILECRRSKVTIRACPFGACHGKQSFIKTSASLLHLIRHGRQVNFTPTEAYLPPGITTAAVKPCCPYCCIYVGQVDERLRPHGLGVWQQGCGDRYGEYLNGTWEFGRPIAPFMSRQNVCGSGFTALRFGWVRFDFVTPDSQKTVYQAHKSNISDESLNESNFEFGLLDVECSIFGNFFRKFPKFVYWKYPTTKSSVSLSRSLSKMLPALGLNNRLSSFSYLNAETPLRRVSRKATFIAEARDSLSIATQILTQGKSVERLSLASRLKKSTQSFSGQFSTETRLDGRDECSQLMHRCADKVRWVYDRLFPFHVNRRPCTKYSPQIPVTYGEAVEGKTLTVTLDSKRGLCPNGWIPATEHHAGNGRWRHQMSHISEEGPAFKPKLPNSPWSVTSLRLEVLEERRTSLTGPHDFLSTPSSSRITSVDRPLSIHIDGWQKTGSGNSSSEAMVFIHGYKTPLHEAPLLLGQLIALGAFPNRIKPFMFLWPAGTKVWHYYQARRASEHYLCQRGLVLFLKSLAHRGIKSIHILAHSMGSRLFMNALKFALRSELFVKNAKKSPGLRIPHGSLDLVNLVFLHPEHYLDDFVLEGGYDAARGIATQTTIYCHSNDEALKTAEILSKGRKCMGKHPFGYVRGRQSLPATIEMTKSEPIKRVEFESETDLHNFADSTRAKRSVEYNISPRGSQSHMARDISPSRDHTDRFQLSMDNRNDYKRAYRTTKFQNNGIANASPRNSIEDWSPPPRRNSPPYETYPGNMADISPPGNEGFLQDGLGTGGSPASMFECSPPSHRSSGSSSSPSNIPTQDYEWLDVDVIDCTYLDANVHGLRHCFFNINSSVIGDLRKVRASQRYQTLERRDGNVYTFRTPPAELSSIFGI